MNNYIKILNFKEDLMCTSESITHYIFTGCKNYKKSKLKSLFKDNNAIKIVNLKKGNTLTGLIESITHDGVEKKIVLIKNIERNLSLLDQEKILPDLTILFPNIQFIITTNSPVILASIEAECINLETNEVSNNLCYQSYVYILLNWFNLKSMYSNLSKNFINRLSKINNIKYFDETISKNNKAITDSLNLEIESLRFDLLNKNYEGKS